MLCLVATMALTTPAMAQLSAGGPSSGGGVASGPPSPQPRPRVPDFAPAAVPGAGGAALATSQAVPKLDTGNPTTELFTAVNSGDYNGAQDAVSRGADLTAQNALGETPLDLSIALNRNAISFMLLSARNESAEGGGGPTAPALAPASGAPRRHGKFKATPARMVAPPAFKSPPTISAGPGTADPNAGFLGFNH